MWGRAYHLKRPDPSYPDLELAFYTPDIVKLNTFPPASSSRFPPEQQELLSHANSVTVGNVVALDVGAQACKSNTANDSLVRLSSAMAPKVVVVETTGTRLALHLLALHRGTHPAVNISIRCCSVVPGSSLFLRPEKMPSCFNSASPAARLISSISG